MLLIANGFHVYRSQILAKQLFTFAILPRYNEKQLRLFKATKLGDLDRVLATELHEFAKMVTTLNEPDRKIVLAALAGYCLREVK
jgi:hypothetical protein